MTRRVGRPLPQLHEGKRVGQAQRSAAAPSQRTTKWSPGGALVSASAATTRGGAPTTTRGESGAKSAGESRGVDGCELGGSTRLRRGVSGPRPTLTAACDTGTCTRSRSSRASSAALKMDEPAEAPTTAP